ncbi:MAG: right-handed parallel beta-helix repeat-containing protein [Caldilineales bacterium]
MIVVALLLAVAWMVAATGTASAATIVVNGVTCTLADAITAANSDTATGGCPAGNGADTLDLVTDITLTSRLPDITSDVAILGNGHTVRRSPSAPAFGILWIDSYQSVTIDNITITGGTLEGGIRAEYEAHVTITNSLITENSAASRGGGIFCDLCFVTVTNSVISDNTAITGGGGIHLRGALRATRPSNDHVASKTGPDTGVWNVLLRNSTLCNNTADTGGGLYTTGAGNYLLEKTTLRGNSARLGGGVYNFDSGGTIENSTLSGNTATEQGGAIYLRSGAPPFYSGVIINLNNSTVTDSSAPFGAGLYIQSDAPPDPPYAVATLRPHNSIMAAQDNGADCVIVGPALIESQGYNIESATSCGFTATGDQQNVTAAMLNLAPLANNGGPTWTHALTSGSAAIDQGNCPNVAADQRGYPRPIDQPGVPNAADGCDVGAFELQVPTAVTGTTLTADNRPASSPSLLMIVVVLIASLLLAKHRRITGA